MSELSRRGFIGSAAAAASLAGLTAAADEDFSFKNNVPDPLLSGKELPTFKFELEKSQGKVIGASYGKEATVEQLPISKGIAGVSMKLEPGAMRELHWHATAAEWAFVIEGRVRTTVIDPRGRAETNDFEPGDIWYFPRGHGHMLECLGNKPAHFILIFDTATSRNSGHSALPTGSVTPPSTSWRRTSACRNRLSKASRKTKFTSRAARSRPRRSSRTSKGRSLRRPILIDIGCSLKSLIPSTRAGASGGLVPTGSRSRRRSRASSS